MACAGLQSSALLESRAYSPTARALDGTTPRAGKVLDKHLRGEQVRSSCLSGLGFWNSKQGGGDLPAPALGSWCELTPPKTCVHLGPQVVTLLGNSLCRYNQSR